MLPAWVRGCMAGLRRAHCAALRRGAPAAGSVSALGQLPTLMLRSALLCPIPCPLLCRAVMCNHCSVPFRQPLLYSGPCRQPRLRPRAGGVHQAARREQLPLAHGKRAGQRDGAAAGGRAAQPGAGVARRESGPRRRVGGRVGPAGGQGGRAGGQGPVGGVLQTLPSTDPLSAPLGAAAGVLQSLPSTDPLSAPLGAAAVAPQAWWSRSVWKRCPPSTQTKLRTRTLWRRARAWRRSCGWVGAWMLAAHRVPARWADACVDRFPVVRQM